MLVYLGFQFCEAFGGKRFTFCLFFKGSKRKELYLWGSGEDLGGAEEGESRNILYEKEFNSNLFKKLKKEGSFRVGHGGSDS